MKYRSRVLFASAGHAPRQVVEVLRGFCEVIEGQAESEVLRLLENRHPDIVVVYASDSTAQSDLTLARQVRSSNKSIPLILIAANSTEELAIAALRAGYSNYFKQPVSSVELAAAVDQYITDRAVGDHSPKHQVVHCGSLEADSPMLGQSPLIRELRSRLQRIASSDCNVLITGETGTGKELIAELVHFNSVRGQKSLVRINCAAVPDSLFESELFGYEKGAFTGAHALKEGRLKLADGGSVFLDEIGDMSSYTQAKILRVVENKEVERLGGTRAVPLDVRVIAATNQDLDQLVANRQFRGDLYFRLDVIRIHLPPLRNRKEDIPLLVDHYIRKLNSRFHCQVEGLNEETLDSLLSYSWPGNVRELKNLLESVFVNIRDRRISFGDLPERFRERLKSVEATPQDDREKLLSALLSTDWNKSRAAQKLHWSRMTLYRKMAKYRVGAMGQAKTA